MYTPSYNKRNSNKGFTLLEIAVVVMVVGILASLAVISGESLMPNVRTRSAAKQFAKYVDHLRMTALRNNRETRICMDSYDSAPATLSSANKGQYTLYIGDKSLNSASWDTLPGDFYDNNVDDDSTTGVIDISKTGKHFAAKVSIADWGSDIGGPYTGNSNCIVFSPRGWVLNPASDFNSMGFIEITFVNKVARSNGLNHDYIVMISRTGFTRIDNAKARLNEDYFSGTGYDAAEKP